MQGFRELIQLHLASEADRKAARQQDELRTRITALEEDVVGAKSRLALAEEDLKRIQHDKRVAELDIQKLDDQRAKYRSQLMTAKTNEIYRTLISEIETAGRAISERETVVIELMESADRATALVAEAKMDLAKAESLRAAEERNLQAQVDALEAQRTAARGRVTALEPQVPAGLLQQYRRTGQARGGRGMALAVGSQCTDCHVSIRPQEWVDLVEPDEICTCPGCGRILYRQESAGETPA